MVNIDNAHIIFNLVEILYITDHDALVLLGGFLGVCLCLSLFGLDFDRLRITFFCFDFGNDDFFGRYYRCYDFRLLYLRYFEYLFLYILLFSILKFWYFVLKHLQFYGLTFVDFS